MIPCAFCRQAIAEFDIASGEPVFLYTPPSMPSGFGQRLGLRLSPDGQWLVVEVVSTNNTLFGGLNFAFSPDGTRFARGPETILVYELATGAVVGRVERSAAPVTSMRFIDNTTIETVNANDGIATLWDVTTGERR